jgi:zinc resistance-associated protein
MKRFATLAAATVLTLTGAAAIAQTATPPQNQPTPNQAPQAQGDNARRPRLTQADFEALTDARIAGIQAGLKLNSDQQRLWTPVEQAMRAMAAERTRRFEEFRQRREAGAQQRPDLAERLERQAQRQTANAQRLTELANAVKPLYASLDENQKRILPVLMRQGREGRRGGRMDRRADHHGMHHGMRHSGMMEHGRMGGAPQQR